MLFAVVQSPNARTTSSVESTSYFSQSTYFQSLVYLWLAFSTFYHIFSLCRLTTLTIHNSLALHFRLKPTSFTDLSHHDSTTSRPDRFFRRTQIFCTTRDVGKIIRNVNKTKNMTWVFRPTWKRFYRASYASAVLGVVILSVRPSVCLSHACFVTNSKNVPAIFYTNIWLISHKLCKIGT